MVAEGEIRIGELARRVDLPVKTLRRLADQGEIPMHRSDGGHRVFRFDEVARALGRSVLDLDAALAGGGIVVPESDPPHWRSEHVLDGLDEALVWGEAATALGLGRTSEAFRIMAYAFTEMLNNAIDHSGGRRVGVELWNAPAQIAFRIADDGRGVFSHVREGLGLESDLAAAAELTKGKRTTFKERHTGEGIFFTSKVVNLFRLSANGIRLTVDNDRGDSALGVSPVRKGTMVEARLSLPPRRTLRSVFEEFTDEDLRFSRSRPTVKLFGTGLLFVSRSEARRVMADMTDFDDIDIDFAGVDDVGQGFVDEILRVWPSEHPGIRVHPINMNDAVAFMVRRALRTIG
ncbi:MAG: MerR family DNA-binding transcriptional regulator [Tessaracoccus sp.]